MLKTSARTYESYCDLSRQYDPNPSPKKLDDGTEVPAYDGPGVDTFVQDFGRDDLLSYSAFVILNIGTPLTLCDPQ